MDFPAASMQETSQVPISCTALWTSMCVGLSAVTAAVQLKGRKKIRRQRLSVLRGVAGKDARAQVACAESLWAHLPTGCARQKSRGCCARGAGRAAPAARCGRLSRPRAAPCHADGTPAVRTCIAATPTLQCQTTSLLLKLTRLQCWSWHTAGSSGGPGSRQAVAIVTAV